MEQWKFRVLTNGQWGKSLLCILDLSLTQVLIRFSHFIFSLWTIKSLLYLLLLLLYILLFILFMGFSRQEYWNDLPFPPPVDHVLSELSTVPLLSWMDLHGMTHSFTVLWLWELDHKEGWLQKNWYFQALVLEKTLESPLDSKIKPASPKRNQSWIFIGRTDAQAKTPILWPPDAKNWLIGKDPDARKDWGQEEKGTTEDEMVGCHHRLNGPEFQQAPGDIEGQGNQVCCSPWRHKESNTTELPNSKSVSIGWL